MQKNDIVDLPPVTVIVPVYNAEVFLEECINSILNLDYPEDKLEIIFVDNNSRDRSPAILKKYEGRIRVLTEETQGAAAARNTGIRNAHNEIIAFTDADCEANRNWLKNLVKPLLNDEDIDAVGGRILSREPCNSIEKFGEVLHNHERKIKVLKPPCFITMNILIKKSLLLEARMFDEYFIRGEDTDLSFTLHKMGYRPTYAHEAIVYHRNEKTLIGLFREGFGHGFWKAKIVKKHRGGRPSFPLCRFVYQRGKRIGEFLGSMKSIFDDR